VFEPSFDIEFSVSKNPDGSTKSISNQISEIIRVASQPERVQSDVFVSQIVPIDHPNARPIMEVGFKKGASWDDISEAVAAFQENGIDGFTMARDDRGNVIGLRAQYIPEFSAVYDSLDHLDPQMVASKMQDWVSRANAASTALDQIDNVSYKKNGTVSTIVYGLEEYATARPIEPGSTSRAAELGRRRSIAEQRRQVSSGPDAGQAVESGTGGLQAPAGDVQPTGSPSQEGVAGQRFMPSDTDYLSAVKQGDTKAAQQMVDEAAKAAGYTIGPVYHGTPTGGFNVFDKRMRGETSGVVRQAFSFTTDKQAAEGYSKRLGDEAVRLDAGLRVANDAMRMFDKDIAAQEYFSSKGYTSVDDGMLPEFDWGSIDDVPEFIKELRGYAKDLKPINKKLSDNFVEAAKVMTTTKAVPEVKRVFLRIPENAPVFQATPATLGQVMSGFSAEKQPTKAGIVELPGGDRIYYVADSSQVKLADPVTKDLAGNVIPLSQRFKASDDIRYMPSPDSAMPGAYSFPGGYRALPGKAKGSLRLYGPAGSLIGIASSLDEAQRILRRKNK
jgi:hypothetical protein